LTGSIRSWIEVGTPEAARIHRAAKAAPRVAVYVHKEPTQFLARLDGEKIHQGAAVEIWSLDRALLTALADHLDRRVAFSLSVNDRELFLAFATATLHGHVTRHHLR